jgi:PKD repeat protein
VEYSHQPLLRSGSLPAMKKSAHESAFSSIMGILLLIAITMITGSILFLTISSQPIPEKVPMAYLGISKTSEGVNILNKAGDTLTRSSISILVDGVDRTSEFRLSGTTLAWDSVKPGEYVSYTSATAPESIQVIYSGASGQYLLASTGPAVNAQITTGTTPLPGQKIIGGTEAPSAEFMASQVTGVAPLTIQFNDISTGSPTSWEWTFGDNESPGSSNQYSDPTQHTVLGYSLQNPSHTYQTAGVYSVTLTASNAGGSSTSTKTNYISVSMPLVGAEVVSTTLPASMNAGQSYPVSVTMKNTGSTTWNEAGMVRLGGVGDGTGDAAKFGPVRMKIPSGMSILPGSQYTFNFTMTAPSLPGPYTPRYRMVWEGQQWFGDQLSQPVQVVSGAVNAQVVATSIPSAMNSGQSYPVSVTMKNTGSMTWNEESMVRLGGVGDGAGDAAKFGSVRMKIPAGTSVSPGSQYTFSFTMTPPAITGSFTPRYQMVWEGHQWFGERAAQPVSGAGAGTPPKAQFTSDVTEGESPLSVQFTDQSTGTAPFTYHWDFSDGTGNLPENSQQNPLWRFWKDAGTSYTVTLTVTNAYGSDATVRPYYINLGSVPVTTAPVAAFLSSVQTGPAPLTVQFTDQSLSDGKNSYQWDVNNDGVIECTTQNPTYTYQAAGDYTVKLTVTNTSGSDSVVKTQYIKVLSPLVTGSPPTVQFTASATSGQSPLSVRFTDQSVSATPLSYQWDVNNDGIVDYTTQNPSHTYLAAGDYTVKLTVTNANGTASETKTKYISVSSLQSGDCFGAETCNPTGNPIGGGAGYTRQISPATAGVKYVVSTKADLLTALKSAKSGEVVFVKGTAVIDMTGTPNTVIPAGVTLASDRGTGGSSGALIKYNSNTNGQYLTSMFVAGGNNVRITGLQLQGETFAQDGTGNGEASYMIAIKAQDKSGLEVDNCEIQGWSWSAVTVLDCTGTYIHHNYIHHDQARGEGYGADIYGGSMLVEANIFDYNRHDIAAGGYPGESYEARYNLVLGDGHPIGSHHFDVHACNPNDYSDDSETSSAFIAGNLYKIHHNTFEAGQQAAIGIRSRPVTGAYINNNIFVGATTDTDGGVPVWQRAVTWGNMFVSNNYWKGTLYTGDKIVWYLHP